MNPIRHIRRFAGVLAGLAGLAAVLVASGATPAFAMVVPPPGGPAGAAVPPARPPPFIPSSPAACPAGRSP